MLFGLLAMSAARAGTFPLTLIALNDFHGNLESPGKFRASAQSLEVPAGGADYLAGYVAYLARFAGAKFQYLAANVVDAMTGKTLFPAFTVKTYHGVKVAFIGLTLKDTPA